MMMREDWKIQTVLNMFDTEKLLEMFEFHR